MSRRQIDEVFHAILTLFPGYGYSFPFGSSLQQRCFQVVVSERKLRTQRGLPRRPMGVPTFCCCCPLHLSWARYDGRNCIQRHFVCAHVFLSNASFGTLFLPFLSHVPLKVKSTPWEHTSVALMNALQVLLSPVSLSPSPKPGCVFLGTFLRLVVLGRHLHRSLNDSHAEALVTRHISSVGWVWFHCGLFWPLRIVSFRSVGAVRCQTLQSRLCCGTCEVLDDCIRKGFGTGHL